MVARYVPVPEKYFTASSALALHEVSLSNHAPRMWFALRQTEGGEECAATGSSPMLSLSKHGS